MTKSKFQQPTRGEAKLWNHKTREIISGISSKEKQSETEWAEGQRTLAQKLKSSNERAKEAY